MARSRSNRDRTRAAAARDVAARNAAADPATARSDGGRHAKRPGTEARRRQWPLIGLGLVAALLAGVGGFAVLTGGPAADPADDGRAAGIVEGVGGTWSEITVDDLDAMLAAKDFTLLNVKTPYIGEIDGTDLYIPYDQLAARASELPTDRAAKLVVYCRSGNQSAIAAQTLVDLGYANVVNVDGGMVAWVDGGRQLVQRDRS